MFRISDTTTADLRWELSVSPDQVLHMPHLGLIAHSYYRPGQADGLDDWSAERTAIRRAIAQGLAPLIRLEPDASVQQEEPGNRPAQ